MAAQMDSFGATDILDLTLRVKGFLTFAIGVKQWYERSTNLLHIQN